MKVARHKYAVNNDFPQRYIDILNDPNAHSDDEWYESKKVHIIKKLEFRSEKADQFMRRLDSEMHKERRYSQQARTRVLPKTPILSTITSVRNFPRGHPIDFYDATWFNDELPFAKKATHVDSTNVAFLPDATMSLRPRPHPSERFGQKRFTEQFWNLNTKDYDLSFLKVEDEEVDESDPDEAEEGVEIGDIVSLSDEEEDDDEQADNISIELQSDGGGKGKAKANSDTSVIDEDERMFDLALGQDQDEYDRDHRFQEYSGRNGVNEWVPRAHDWEHEDWQ